MIASTCLTLALVHMLVWWRRREALANLLFRLPVCLQRAAWKPLRLNGSLGCKQGQVDRVQLAADYSAQLTDNAVQAMSWCLKEDEYGAPPTGARVLKARTIADQTFFVVKLLFPRGDAANLLL